MANSVERFLGFAFASADLLLELNADGKIVFVAGAAHSLTGRTDTELMGLSWRDLISLEDCAMAEALFTTLSDGDRRGPLTVSLAPPSQLGSSAAFSLCRLSATSNIACALSRGGVVSTASETDAAGFQSRVAFEALASELLTAARTIGQELDFALVEAPGLSGMLHEADRSQAQEIIGRFAGALRAESYGGAPAAWLGAERYALIRAKASGSDLINKRISTTLAAAIVEGGVTTASVVLDVDMCGQSVARSMRALSYAMDQFQAEGVGGLKVSSLTEAFNHSLQNTLAKAGAIGDAIREHRFSLAYQPIVDLKTHQVKHYETLVRFADDSSPYELIRMAEELALIEQLDLAVARKAFAKIHTERVKELKLAVNISGRSAENPGFLTEFRRITAHQPDLISRLIIEITESAQIRDLKLANRNIQRMRADGHLVCLDDFGAGSASMSYLQALQVDVVKIDGRYVKELCGDGREAALVKHIVALCHELGIDTIAEMIETEAVEEAARRAGADSGQGYLYGKPMPEPKPPTPRSARMLARRKGAVETWG